jgi:hypothetical protein
MKESTLWTLIRDKVPGHLIRIENLVGVGQPDVNACYEGTEAWLELKLVKGNYIYFRSSQLAFFSRRCKEKGRVFVLARKDDDLILFRAASVVAVAELFEPVKDGACRIKWALIPDPYVFSKPWAWQKIADLIFKS